MNPHVWWYVARGGGLVAYALLAASTVWGLAVSTRLLGRWPAPGWTLDLHRFLGALALTFTGVHLAGLLLDSYVQFDLLSLVVPFASSWRPGAVAWGVVGLYLLVAVELTSLARRRLPHRLWRRVHLGAFPLLAASTIHLLGAGRDRASRPVVALLAATLAAVAFLVLFKLLLPSRDHRAPRARSGRTGGGDAPGHLQPRTAIGGRQAGGVRGR